jgi:hypothetical protein
MDTIVQPQEKVWRPHPKQEFLLSLPDSVFEALYGGAAGGGKSELLMMLPLVRGFHQYPRFKGIFFRRTHPELEKEVILRSKEYFNPSGAKYNEQKKCWTWPSGAVLFFSHLEHEGDVKKHDTSEYNYVAFDELTSFTEFQYKYIVSQRCRTSSELPAIARSGTNPGNVGHGWVKRHFHIPSVIGAAVENEVEPYKIIRDKTTGNLKVFVQALLSDNPKLDPNYGNHLEITRSISEADYQAKKYGRWDVFEGQVFEDFRIERLESEPENAFHVIDPPAVETWYPKILAIDWGYTAMTYACWGQVLPNKRTQIFREFACKKEKISYWANEIKQISREIGDVADIVLCRSAFANRGDEKTIAQQFEEHSGFAPRQADNDRIGGKFLIQDFLRWKPKPQIQGNRGEFDSEYAARLMRVQGLDAYEAYLNSFKEPEIEGEIPRLHISAACPVLIKTIPLCVYDEDDKEDVKEFDGDDPYDCLRYFCKAVDYYVSRSAKELAKREKVSKILEQQRLQPDQNRFYMQMRKYEAANRLKSKPVKRFHYA